MEYPDLNEDTYSNPEALQVAIIKEMLELITMDNLCEDHQLQELCNQIRESYSHMDDRLLEEAIQYVLITLDM